MPDSPSGKRARVERLEMITDALRKRMRPLCADMSEEAFHDLIERMAEVQLRYETRDESPLP